LPGAGCLRTGRKPVPLQAGHISSTTSDSIGFIMRAGSGDESPEWITYTFPKFRNQLRGVTLNNKVKLNPLLMSSPAIEYVRYGV
jgi:hypothetical protein